MKRDVCLIVVGIQTILYLYHFIMSSNDDVDAWIAQLMQCKPLNEAEVKKLCDKVIQAARLHR